MRFSIITPTLQRDSLIQCCNSVDEQIFTDWEQIIVIDGGEKRGELFSKIDMSKRHTFTIPETRNYGNTPRHLAWLFAKGEYVIYLDDDNTMADAWALAGISACLEKEGNPPLGVFPILRHGRWFFSTPPRLCHTDTANLVIKREFAQWPNIPDYTADGIFAESLVKKHGYVAFGSARPIVNMPKSSEGK